MKLEMLRRADGNRCRISCEGPILETVTELAGKPARTRRTTHRDAAAAEAAAHKQIAKLVDQDHVAAEIGGVLQPLEELAGQLGVDRRLGGEHVLVIEGDCVVPHDLALDFRRGLLAGYGDEVIAGVYVSGYLTVAGCIVNWENDYGPFLRVDGSVRVEAMATGGSEILIGGDLVVEREIIGVYNHGAIRVRGDLRARAIASEHTVEAEGKLDAMRWSGHHGKVYRVEGGASHGDDPYELRGVFSAALIRDQTLQLSEARRQVARGKAISLPSFTSVRAHTRKLFGKKLESPERVKTISLAQKDLTSLPDELFEFPNLRRLDLKFNHLATLPAAIARLTRLEELYLWCNGLQRLPDEIGELGELRILDLYSNCVIGLPDTLERCQRLEIVNLSNNPYASVNRKFGGWGKVELMWTFPEVLTRLPRLRRLDLENTFIKNLPRSPFASAALERTVLRWTLIGEPATAMHPQLEVDIGSSLERAVAYIGSWFDRDDLMAEARFDPETKRFDWSHAAPLLELLLEINIPISAPYEAALEKFTAQSAHLAKYLMQDPEHARDLFATLRDALERCAPRYPENALIDGLGALFARHAG